MLAYCVDHNAQENGDHEVHHEACPRVPCILDRLSLGSFRYCQPAVQAARNYYSQVNGCAVCSSECHSG